MADNRLTFEKIHELGAQRHPHTWLNANRVAASNLWDSDLRVDDSEVKRAVSLVVLRVLDHVDASNHAARHTRRYDLSVKL
jgi:hypothetical protein